MISNFPRPLPALPPRPGPGSEWLRRGRPRAGAGRMPGPGYKGTRHRPLPTLYLCPVRLAPIPRNSCPRASRPQPAWTLRTPGTDATGPLAGRRAGGRARPAALGLSGPSKRSSAIGAGDSRAERRARPPAGLPPACPDPRLDRGVAPEPGSRQVSALWSRGGSPVGGLWGLVGEGTAARCRDCKEGPCPVYLLGRRLPSGRRPGVLLVEERSPDPTWGKPARRIKWGGRRGICLAGTLVEGLLLL